MRIRIFIQTYNDPEGLHGNLETLYANMGPNPDVVEVEVIVMNNHPTFHIDPKFDKVMVNHDMVRPPWSTGHSARTWNAALMLGFQDLINPACDIVVCIQDDMVWEYRWLYWLREVHTKYNFYTCSWGDGFCSFTPEAVKKIGMWDERFCTNGFHECDYFLRALMHNKEGSSINNDGVGMILNPWKRPLDEDDHGRVWVPHPTYKIFSAEYLKGNIANRKDNRVDTPRLLASVRQHDKSKQMWEHKWGNIPMEFWSQGLIDHPPSMPACSTYMFYPYFEYAIYDLPGKGYFQS